MISKTGKTNRVRRGFTLLELIIVMVLLAIVLAIAAPSLRGFAAGRRTSDAASQILAMMNLARIQAISEGRRYKLDIDEQERCYQLTKQEGGAFVELGNDHGQIFYLPEGVTFEIRTPEEGITTERTTIQFYPDGRNDEASIVVTGRTGDVFFVVCRSATEQFEILTEREAESSGF
jgi:type II secretion system protein H